MSQQKNRENKSVEMGNGQLPEESADHVEELDLGDALNLEDAEERQETPAETLARLEVE